MGILHVAPVGTPSPDPTEDPQPPWRQVGHAEVGQLTCPFIEPDFTAFGARLKRSLESVTLSFEAMADIDWSALTRWFDWMTKNQQKAKRLRKMHTDYARRTRKGKGK